MSDHDQPGDDDLESVFGMSPEDAAEIAKGFAQLDQEQMREQSVMADPYNAAITQAMALASEHASNAMQVDPDNPVVQAILASTQANAAAVSALAALRSELLHLGTHVHEIDAALRGTDENGQPSPPETGKSRGALGFLKAILKAVK